MTAPALSVVVASVNGLPYLGDCLEALDQNAPEAEVIVADWTDEPTRQLVRERWPEVKVLSFDAPTTVPELRAAGIFAATAPNIAVIEDHCDVLPGWAAGMVAAHAAGHSVVGGSIRNVRTRRVRDWAAFFCEYSAFMEPADGGVVGGLPGMNVSYDREAVAAIDDLLRDGHWESWLHPRLQERGFQLWCDPEIVLEHAKDFGFIEFVSQRYHYSRSYAGMRNAELGRKRLLYALGSPLLVPLAYLRIARNVRTRPAYRSEFRRATPLILVYTIVWAIGEAIGYTFGGGRSILKVR
jgi:hypothetical protein